MQKLISASLTLCLFLSTACSTIQFPGVYRIDVGQGNIISEGSKEKLKLGMTPRQVRYVMGNPLIQDPLHPGRWDYLYAFKSGKGPQAENRLTLFFNNERLVKIDDSQYQDPEVLSKALLNDYIEAAK